MSLVNAEIKSAREAISRLINGEKFYVPGYIIYFDDNFPESPFRVESKSGCCRGTSFFGNISKWCIKTEWYENVEDRVLCFVSMTDYPNKYEDSIVPILKRTDRGFIDDCGFAWTYAKPLTREDVLEES